MQERLQTTVTDSGELVGLGQEEKKELKPRTKPQRRSEKVEKAKRATGESLVACLGRAAEDGGRKRSWPEGAVYICL